MYVVVAVNLRTGEVHRVLCTEDEHAARRRSNLINSDDHMQAWVAELQQ